MKVGEIWKNIKSQDFKVKIIVLRFKIDGVRTDNILLEIFKVENYSMVRLGELFVLPKEDFIEQFEKDYDESGREVEEI